MTVKRIPRVGPWHYVGAANEPAFLNSWTNYGTVFAGARFRKSEDGLVVLSGLLAKGGGNWAVENVFVLPVGYRPDWQVILSMRCGITGGDNMGRLDILTNGNVLIQQGGIANPVGYMSLEGLFWYAAP